MSLANRVTRIPFVFKQVNKEFGETVVNSFEGLKTTFSDIHSTYSQEFHADMAKKFEANLVEIDDTKDSFLRLLRSRELYTDTGFEMLENIRWQLHGCIQDIDNLRDLLQSSESKEMYYVQIMMRWSEFKTQYQIDLTRIQGGRYRYSMFTLVGFVFVLVPFLNILSFALGVYQITRPDYRARIFGLLTLLAFFLQGFAVAQLSLVILAFLIVVVSAIYNRWR